MVSTSLALPILRPSTGEVRASSWLDEEGARHTLLVAAIRPHTFVQRGRSGRASGNQTMAGRRYNTWRVSVREQMLVALRMARIDPLEGSMLAAAFAGGARPDAAIGAPRRKDGEVDGRAVKGINDWDATDLQKAVEDVANGLLWKDDRAIRSVVSSIWVDESADWFSIAVWGPRPDKQLRLTALAHWQSEEWLGPTVGDWLR